MERDKLPEVPLTRRGMLSLTSALGRLIPNLNFPATKHTEVSHEGFPSTPELDPINKLGLDELIDQHLRDVMDRWGNA